MSTCLSHPVGRIRDDPISDGMVRLVDELCATRGLGGIEAQHAVDYGARR